MTSNVVNRKTIRQTLAAAMTTDLVGVTKAAKKLYDYKVSEFSAETTHIIVVTSGPTDRARQAETTRVHSFVDLEIWTFVLYSADGWTEENSEDKADDMEKEIMDWLMDHADTSDVWAGIQLNGSTEMDFKVVGGKTYRTEVIPIRLELYSE